MDGSAAIGRCHRGKMSSGFPPGSSIGPAAQFTSPVRGAMAAAPTTGRLGIRPRLLFNHPVPAPAEHPVAAVHPPAPAPVEHPAPVPAQHPATVAHAPAPATGAQGLAIHEAPPPLRHEINSGPPPSPHHVWIPGYWKHDGHAYVWEAAAGRSRRAKVLSGLFRDGRLAMAAGFSLKGIGTIRELPGRRSGGSSWIYGPACDFIG
jgi:hypothetical protein